MLLPRWQVFLPKVVQNIGGPALLPAGPGTTTILLPLFANKLLVGFGDTVILAYDQGCPGALPQN
jgi:hypothetical protein